MKPAVMIIGLGGLGSAVLELLAREECASRIVVASRNAERGLRRCNLTRLGAIAQGYSPSIDFVPLDLNDGAAVAKTVHRFVPDIIFNSTTLMTWWLPGLLPPEEAVRLKKARFGVWLPVHLALTLKLMKALRDAKYQGVTLSAPFPDVVNCILGRLGLAPTCGIGNLDEIVPKIRHLAAQRLHAPLDDVRVVLVAHHSLEPAAFGEPMDELPPYFLRAYLGDGKDVTEAVHADELLLSPCPLPSGPAWNFLTAGTAVRMLQALSRDGEARLHAPGPHGLPGGYPVTVRRGSIECAPIEGLALADAIAINERSHRFDGIERIEPDGTAVFCPEDADVLRRTLGYECERLQPEDAEERAKELIARFREFARGKGVDLEHPGALRS